MEVLCRLSSTVLAMSMLLTTGSGSAAEPYQEYNKRIEAAQSLTALFKPEKEL